MAEFEYVNSDEEDATSSSILPKTQIHAQPGLNNGSDASCPLRYVFINTILSDTPIITFFFI